MIFYKFLKDSYKLIVVSAINTDTTNIIKYINDKLFKNIVCNDCDLKYITEEEALAEYMNQNKSKHTEVKIDDFYNEISSVTDYTIIVIKNEEDS